MAELSGNSLYDGSASLIVSEFQVVDFNPSYTGEK